MNEHSYLPNFGNDDVIAFSNTMLKSLRFKDAIRHVLEYKTEDLIDEHFKSQNLEINRYSNHGRSRTLTYSWNGQGVECEVLKLGANNWQKGRIQVRVSVEFIPDEPEKLNSPLDDIRKTIK